ncbi:GNAT family N-acetyltransferase [Paenibacillus kyungheensis]
MDNSVNVQITAYQPADLNQVIYVLERCGDDAKKELFIENHKRTFAWCARKKEQIIGVLVGWTNNFHPYANYISLHIHPKYRLEAVEDKLIKALQQVPSVYPFQMSSWKNQYPTSAFYTRNHFEKIRCTYTARLDLNKVINDSLTSHKAIISSKNYIMYDLEQWKNIDTYLYDLAIHIRDDYAQKHMVNPLGVYEIKKWQELLDAEDIIKQGSYIVYDYSSKQIVAYGLMHFVNNKVVELGWSNGKLNALKKWESILWKQFYLAWNQGYYSVEMEIDNTDQERLNLLDQYPFETISILNTYHLNT